jgi:hypothetical protein
VIFLKASVPVAAAITPVPTPIAAIPAATVVTSAITAGAISAAITTRPVSAAPTGAISTASTTAARPISTATAAPTAATTVTATPKVPTPAAATTIPATTAAAILFLCLLDSHLFAADGGVVERLDRSPGLGVVRHIYKAKAFALPCFPVHYNLCKIHRAVQFKHFFQIHIIKIIRKTCYKKLHADRFKR